MKKIIIFSIIFVILIANALAVTSNLEVELPEQYQEIPPGNDIIFTTKVLDLADLGKRDITLRYEIIGLDGEILASRSETVAVQTQASFVGNLKVPADIEKGRYVLRVILVSETEGEVETEKSFIVTSKKFDYSPYYPYIAIGAITVVIVLFILLKGETTLRRMFLRQRIRGIIRRKLSQ